MTRNRTVYLSLQHIIGLIAIITLFGFSCTKFFSKPRAYYIATDGSDQNPGTNDQPFATLERAKKAIRDLKKDYGLPAGGVIVWLRQGRYFLSQLFQLELEDSGSKESPIFYSAYPNEQVIISGGRVITGWNSVSKNIWTVELLQVKDGSWYFRQLFANGKRLTRARMPNNGFYRVEGYPDNYLKIQKQGVRVGVNSDGVWINRDYPKVFCGFKFKPGDIQIGPDFRQAEIISYHAFQCSWRTIQSIDLKRHEVLFNTPSRYPNSAGEPYRIENIAEALDEPGEWYLNREMGVLFYLAHEGENPNEMDFIAPVLNQLVMLSGDWENERFVEYIRFSGLSFRDSDYPLGIYDISPDWPADAIKAHPDWPREFPPGYTDAQAAPLCGQAVELIGARYCAFKNCEFTNIGNYAIRIGKGCHQNQVVGCYLHDLGGGGVLLGMAVRDVEKAGVPRQAAASENTIANNVIRHCSLIHPSAVGIWIAQSHHNRIAHNEISDIGYAGIHLGWTWGYGANRPNYSDHNLIEYNHVHHVIRDLTDSGGIYSLGILTGTIYRGNYVHDIKMSKEVKGFAVNGIMLDENSHGITLVNNIVRRTPAGALRFNGNKKEDHVWIDNHFECTTSLLAGKICDKIVRQARLERAYRKKFHSLFSMREEYENP